MNGKELAHEGMAQAIENEEKDWLSEYTYKATSCFLQIPVGFTFTSENIRNFVVKHIGEPHHYGVWGAVFRKFIEHRRSLGEIEDAGFILATRATSHHRPIRQYRRIK